MRPYEIKLARVVHIAFYMLLFALPLTGWALTSLEDEPLHLFSWFAIPRLGLSNEDTLEEVHEMLFNGLVILALLHAAGAVKHWFESRRRAALA